MTTSALLIIDVQESFRQRDSWARNSNPAIADRVIELVAHARRTETDVYWILHTEPGSGTVFDPALGFTRMFAEFKPLGTEPILSKTSRNAFTTTNLAQRLTARGTQELIITGIQTEQCCETTARLGADLGYLVTFVTDATATFPITRPDTGEVLAAADVVARTEFALAGRFATITTTAEILARG